jgi:hypothetical protein
LQKSIGNVILYVKFLIEGVLWAKEKCTSRMKVKDMPLP